MRPRLITHGKLMEPMGVSCVGEAAVAMLTGLLGMADQVPIAAASAYVTTPAPGCLRRTGRQERRGTRG